MNLKSAVIFLAIMVSSSCNGQEFPDILSPERIKMLEPPSGSVRMVLDTDTYNEIDDQFALVYALLSPEKLKLEAVYAAPFYNKRSTSADDGMEQSYKEILRILDMLDMGHEDFAFKGSTEFIKDIKLPEKSPAVIDLIDRAKKSSPDDPLHVVAVGAITNVANAILIDPSIIKNIIVVWLGGNGHHWPHQREFNFFQDIHASRTIFDCGVPFVQVPCTPVVTHLATTIPEMERYLGGKGAIGDYLLQIFKDYHSDTYAWSKVLWDMSAIAYVINPDWTPSNLVHSPVVTDQYTFSIDESRHFIRVVYFVKRDDIFGDFFKKLEK